MSYDQCHYFKLAEFLICVILYAFIVYYIIYLYIFINLYNLISSYKLCQNHQISIKVIKYALKILL